MHEGTVRGALGALQRLTKAFRAKAVERDEAISQARRLRRVVLLSHSPTWRKRKAKATRRAANKVARRSRRINRMRAR